MNISCKNSGFTLIELMIVLVIVGLLAAVAFPAYNDFVVRSKVNNGFAMLSTLRLQMEQYYQDNRSFVSTGTSCGIADSSDTYFDYSCTGTATTYTWTANSRAGQGLGNSGDYGYTIDQSGNQATLKFDGAASSSSCWEYRAGKCS